MSDDDFLALNQLTGRVHKYGGAQPGGIGADENGLGIGVVPCGCDGFEEGVLNDTIMAIQPKHLERGIWEPADCLNGESDE